VYDRSGTPRFYGFGNNSPIYNQTVYTNQQLYARVIAGYNITRQWQIAYEFMPRKVTILGARLQGIPSLTSRFYGLLGIGTTEEMLSRVIITYDSRDDITVPTRGYYVQAYGGVAGRAGEPDNSLFSEAGMDARGYWTAGEATWAAHWGVRYMPSAVRAPFWALSSLGGDTNVLGDSEPLRGYGTGRFYDRNSVIFNLEYRRHIFSVDAVGTHIDVQLTPFVDAGRVFHNTTSLPLTHMHTVGGFGFRAIARPSVVGYVDVGWGGEGAAVFTGINYPF
jgi:outer membrane protein assembly factor BamA